MKHLLILITISVVLFSCKASKQLTAPPPTIEKYSTVTTIIHDTVLTTKADTASLAAKLMTDSTGKISIAKNTVIQKGKGQAKAPAVKIVDNQLFVDCFCDTAQILFQMKSQVKIDSTVNTIVLPPVTIEKPFTKWQKFQIWAGRFYLSCSLIWLILFVLRRLKYI